MTSKRILLTGATGFVGRHILNALLQQGHEVHATFNKPLNSQALNNTENLTWHACDLLHPASLQPLLHEVQPQVFIHAAWYAEHGKFWYAAENLAWLEASKQLVQLFAQSGGERFIGIGTCAEYDWKQRPADAFCVESEICKPHTLYGQSKHALHEYIQASHFNFSYSWARLFLTFGPNEPPAKLIPSVINALLKQQIATCNTPNLVRDFGHVSDIGLAISHLANHPYTGAINIASGEGYALAEVVQKIANLIGKPELISLATNIPPNQDPPYLVADVSNMHNMLNYQFGDLEAQLTATIGWWANRDKAN